MSAESRSGKRTLSLFGPARGSAFGGWATFVIKVREGSHRQHAGGVCSPETE